MSGYESPRPEDETIDGAPNGADLDAADFDPDERPVDEAAARAHDVLPDDEKPVLLPDSLDDDEDDEAGLG